MSGKQVNHTSNHFILEESFEKSQINASCRICLAQHRQSQKQQNQLISPCDCTGSLEYVHEGCLSIWIKQKLNPGEKKVGQNERTCELCSGTISYKMQIQTSWRTCQEIKKKVLKELLNFFLGLLFLLCFFTLIYLTVKTAMRIESVEKTLLAVVGMLICLIFSVFCFYFIRKFLRKRRYIVIPFHRSK